MAPVSGDCGLIPLHASPDGVARTCMREDRSLTESAFSGTSVQLHRLSAEHLRGRILIRPERGDGRRQNKMTITIEVYQAS